jgi:hypothetical protein
MEVEQNQVRRPFDHRSQAGLAVGHGVNAVSLGLQDARHEAPLGKLVVDHQHERVHERDESLLAFRDLAHDRDLPSPRVLNDDSPARPMAAPPLG